MTIERLQIYLKQFYDVGKCIQLFQTTLLMRDDDVIAGATNLLINHIVETIEVRGQRINIGDLNSSHQGCPTDVSSLYEDYINKVRMFQTFLQRVIDVIQHA